MSIATVDLRTPLKKISVKTNQNNMKIVYIHNQLIKINLTTFIYVNMNLQLE